MRANFGKPTIAFLESKLKWVGEQTTEDIDRGVRANQTSGKPIKVLCMCHTFIAKTIDIT